MNLPAIFEEIFSRAVFYSKCIWEFAKAYGIFFLPSLTLILGGFIIYIHPQAFIYVLSVFLVSLGGVGMLCTWKALILKEKIQEFTQKLDGRVMIHGIKIQDIDDLDADLPIDPKDQIIH